MSRTAPIRLSSLWPATYQIIHIAELRKSSDVGSPHFRCAPYTTTTTKPSLPPTASSESTQPTPSVRYLLNSNNHKRNQLPPLPNLQIAPSSTHTISCTAPTRPTETTFPFIPQHTTCLIRVGEKSIPRHPPPRSLREPPSPPPPPPTIPGVPALRCGAVS